MSKTDQKKQTAKTTGKRSTNRSKGKRKVVKAARAIAKNTIVAAVPAPLRTLVSRSRVLAANVAPLLLNDDESLLKALEEDGAEFYNDIDSEASKTVFNALRDSKNVETPGQLKLLGAEPPGAEATIFMVSNRPEYCRSDTTRYGVREVKVNTSNRHVQIGQTEINEVPCVAGENLLLFVHGFNNSATDAALAAWRLGNDLKGIDKTVFFSWPSKASVTSYYADYKIANASVPYVVQCIQALAKNRAGKVHIVAHSMGCRLLMMTLIKYITTTNAVNLGQVYFIAGDVDQDVFRVAMERLGGAKVVTNLNNIASDYDYALIGSKQLHWKDRCGLYTPVVFSPFDPPSFMSLLRPYPGKGNSHGYYNAANIRADISNQVILYHTTVEPKPVDIRTTYKKKRGAKNALVLRN